MPTTFDDSASRPHTAFCGHRRMATDSLVAVALAVKRTVEAGVTAPILIYDDATGRAIDIDTHGSDEDVVARISRTPAPGSRTRPAGRGQAAAPMFSSSPPEQPGAPEPRGPGRPKLGVVAREVTLLPRHWEWLGGQPGGASVALRKLIEEAHRANSSKDRRRQAHEVAFHFMSSIAGYLPGFEEAIRALFTDDQLRFNQWVAPWPEDIRAHASKLAFADRDSSESQNR